MTKQKLFLQLTRDEQAALVRPLMEAGGSYGTVASEFTVTRNRIAGICRDYKIRSNKNPGFGDVVKTSSGYVVRIAESEETRCRALMGDFKCRYEHEPGSDYCARPEHQALNTGRSK